MCCANKSAFINRDVFSEDKVSLTCCWFAGYNGTCWFKVQLFTILPPATAAFGNSVLEIEPLDLSLSSYLHSKVSSLSEDVVSAWKWDVATGLAAGIYQGCIWTFVARIARAELHASNSQMAWIAAAPALGYIFATVWARQMDGRAKMPFIYWTWMAARGLYLLAPFVQTTYQFIVLVCLTPFVFSISTPAYTAVMKEIYPDKHRGRLMSSVRMIASAATLVAALVMGRLLDHGLHWQTAFFIGGIFGISSAFTFSRIKVPPVVKDDGSRLSTRSFVADTIDILRRNPGYRWFTASVFVSGFGNLIATTLYPIYQVDKFHVTNTQVANMQNISMLATIVGFVFWGGFLDRRGPLATVLLSVSINLAVPVLYAFSTSLTTLYIASAAMAVTIAGIDLGYLNTTLLFAERGRVAQYQALHSSFFGIRGSIAPQSAIPLMFLVGPQMTFLISAAIILAGVGLQLISMQGYRKQVTEDKRADRKLDI